MKRFNLTVPGLSKRVAGEKQAIRLSKDEVSDEIQIEEIWHRNQRSGTSGRSNQILTERSRTEPFKIR